MQGNLCSRNNVLPILPPTVTKNLFDHLFFPSLSVSHLIALFHLVLSFSLSSSHCASVMLLSITSTSLPFLSFPFPLSSKSVSLTFFFILQCLHALFFYFFHLHYTSPLSCISTVYSVSFFFLLEYLCSSCSFSFAACILILSLSLARHFLFSSVAHLYLCSVADLSVG